MALAVPHHPRVSMYEGDQSKVDSVVSWFCLEGEEGGRGQARVPHLVAVNNFVLTLSTEYTTHRGGIPSLGLERFRD